MRVVNPEHTAPPGIVKGQRVTHAMRLVSVSRPSVCHDLHPETAADLREEAIKVEEWLEVLAGHGAMISHNDNSLEKVCLVSVPWTLTSLRYE